MLHFGCLRDMNPYERKITMNPISLLHAEAPLIHCITHPIAVNDCANAVLALGARPIMAEHPAEAASIAKMARSLTVSLGNITDARAQSIFLAGNVRPAVIDLVGITCSDFRMKLAKKFLNECHPAVIKGNVSEIRAIAGEGFHSQGIDVSREDAVTKEDSPAQLHLAGLMKGIADRTQAVVAASGEVDIIVSPQDDKAYFLKNGSPSMARITGTGCMLTCIIGTFMAVTSPLHAAIYGAAVLGIAGERADASRGLGTYHTGLLDQLSLMTDETLKSEIRLDSVVLSSTAS